MFRHSLRIAIPKPASVVPPLAFSQIRHPAGPSRRLHASPTRTFREWSYLAKNQDEEKPPLPYQVGATISARTWEPPIRETYRRATFGLKASSRRNSKVSTPWRHAFDNLAQRAHRQKESASTSTLSMRSGSWIRHHSQTAKVKIHDHRSADEKLRSPLPSDVAPIAAKFYDPLCQDIEDEHPDIFRNTYSAFYRETAEVPVPGRRGQSRHVYAILYEHAPGVELSYIEVDEWSQAERMEIMKAIIDGNSWIRQAGIYQEDPPAAQRGPSGKAGAPHFLSS